MFKWRMRNEVGSFIKESDTIFFYQTFITENAVDKKFNVYKIVFTYRVDLRCELFSA